jgi:hypothetical protein
VVDYVGSVTNPNDAFMKARTYAQQLADLSTKQDAGAQYAMGNRAGAARTLAGGGDIAGAQSLEQGEAARLKAQQEYITRALPAFQAAYKAQGAQGFMQAYSMVSPELRRLGMNEAEISKFGAQIQSNPEVALQVLGALAQRKLVFQKDGRGRIYAIEETTGQTVGEPIGEPTPQPMKYVPVPQGGNVAVFDPNQQNPAAPVNQTGSASLSAPPVGGGAPTVESAPQGAPVPPQVPQTAAAPAVPPPMPPAAGAVQPSVRRPPVATSPVGAAPGRGVPPADAVSLGLPNPEGGALPNSPNRQVAGGLGAPPQPESSLPGYVGTIQGPPKPPKPPTAGEQRWRPATAEEQARYPGQSIQVNQTTGEIRAVGRSGGQRIQPQEQAQLAKLRDAVRDATAMADDMKRYMSLNARVETGPRYYTGIQKELASATNEDVSVMSSIISRNTPRMRQGLPGAASDLDVRMFKEALPSLDRPRAANDAIASAVIAWANRQRDYVAFMEDWARKNSTLLGAQEKWDSYVNANPIFNATQGGQVRARTVTPWRQWFGGRGTTQGSQPSQAPSDGWSIQRVP